MARRSFIAAALCGALVACWGPPGHLYFAPQDDSDTPYTPDDSDSEPPMQGNKPVIEEADAWCYSYDDGTEWWGLQAVGDDPQGASTLLTYIEDGVDMRDGGGDFVARLALVCDENGLCYGSAMGDQIDVTCDGATSYVFYFELEDTEGHRSEVAEVQGRWGYGPEG